MFLSLIEGIAPLSITPYTDLVTLPVQGSFDAWRRSCDIVLSGRYRRRSLSTYDGGPPDRRGEDGLAAETATYIDAIRQALGDALRSDDRVVLLGEDIGHFGGAFGATRGLLEKFGPDRVIDTPIAEEGFVGAAIGAAWMGERPVVELQFADFISCPFDMLVTVAAKTHWRSGIDIPLVVRAPFGGGLRAGPYHSSCPEGWFIGTPGLKVVCPSTASDAYGLLRSAIEDDDPVIFFEHKGLYRRAQGASLTGDERTPLGIAAVTRDGEDITVVAYGAEVGLALEAAAVLDGRISVEVIDVRTLWPFDSEAILRSLARTSRLLVVQEAPRSAGLAGHLLSVVAASGFESLDAPPRVHAPMDTPVPFAPELEDAFLPSVESLIKEIEDLAGY